MHYYETTHNDGGDFPVITAHKTFEQAAAFAEIHSIVYIHEVGGNWDEFCKCAWCGEWYSTDELNNDICNRCAAAIHSRGEKW